MNMKKHTTFSGKVVVITGASSGIGKALAKAFAHAGAFTVLVSRGGEKLNKVVAELKTDHPDVLALSADVSSDQQVREMVDHVVAKYGRVDILINNAGTSLVGPTEATDFEGNTKKLLETSFYGTIHLNSRVIPLMKGQKSGQIVNMSSVVGRKAFPRFGSYSAAMHAITGYSDALRQELTGNGISVMTLHPGLTQTELLTEVNPADMPPPFRFMTPMTPDFVAQRVLWALRKKKVRLILPFQARFLLLMDAFSPRLGDLLVRLLSNRFFARFLGTFRGTSYAHNPST